MDNSEIKKKPSSFGSIPEKKMDSRRYENVPAYYRHHIKDDQIDDITWNDLSMDLLYHRIDNTCSAAGEEYLYYLLRTPLYSPEENEKLQKQLSCLTSGDKEQMRERHFIEQALSRLGHTGAYSLYDYIDLLDKVKSSSNTFHIICALLPFLSIALMFFRVELGLLLLIAALVFNLFTYYRERGEKEPYIISFAYLLRAVKCAGTLGKSKCSAFEEEEKELRELCGRLSKFTSSSWLLVSNSGAAGGSPVDIFLSYLRMCLHLDLIKFNTMLSSVREDRAQFDRLITLIGRIDAVISAASFRESLPVHCVPEFTSEHKIEISDLYHPLISDPVLNSITAGGPVLLTGSNASGKSTFLKATALCALLSETVGTCPASACRIPRCRVLTSMALRDDLMQKESYYIVEIRSLRRILSEAEKDSALPVLCFIDEVLRGTNTVERISASAEILRDLANKEVFCFAATHDIELTALLGGQFENYHFEEQIKDNDIVFDYRLRRGISNTRNAIKLLSVMGYAPSIVEKAEENAQRFIASGRWQVPQ